MPASKSAVLIYEPASTREMMLRLEISQQTEAWDKDAAA